MTPRVTRVMVIDHMPLARKAVAESLAGAAALEVVGVASSPRIALRRLETLRPDVILLDLDEPVNEEAALLVPFARDVRVPIVLFTALAESPRRAVMSRLDIAPEMVIEKPATGVVAGIFELAPTLEAKLKRAHTGETRWAAAPQTESASPVAAPNAPAVRRPAPAPPAPKPTPAVAPAHAPIAPVAAARATSRIIAIGASTGGTEVLADVLARLPREMPGIVIVQHMPADFTRKFAERLDQISALAVKEAEDGDPVSAGCVLIAPGGHQLRVMRQGDGFVVRVQETTRVSGHCPSVDVLLSSVAKAAGARGIGVVLTGMGKDGAEGLLAMRQAGARTFAQDRASSIVYGMPAEADRIGGAEKIVSAQDLPRQLAIAAAS